MICSVCFLFYKMVDRVFKKNNENDNKLLCFCL